MPPIGHKSITLRSEDYDYFLELFEKDKEALNRKGIRSFSAYITMKLYAAHENEEN